MSKSPTVIIDGKFTILKGHFEDLIINIDDDIHHCLNSSSPRYFPNQFDLFDPTENILWNKKRDSHGNKSNT